MAQKWVNEDQQNSKDFFHFYFDLFFKSFQRFFDIFRVGVGGGGLDWTGLDWTVTGRGEARPATVALQEPCPDRRGLLWTRRLPEAITMQGSRRYSIFRQQATLRLRY